MIAQLAVPLTASMADAVTVTGTRAWFGGHRIAGEADTDEITGAVVSRTVTVNDDEAVLPRASVVMQPTVVVPRGNVDPDTGLQLATLSPLTRSCVAGAA